MCHGSASIKKRLFFSSIRMVFISLLAFALATRIIMFFLFGFDRPHSENWAYIRAVFGRDGIFVIWASFLVLSVMIVSVFNNFFTHRIMGSITRPLEMLGDGVRQIGTSNFSHRVDYNGNDEFRPICDAFNEMAEKLESSTEQRRKDEANRRELIAGISHDLRTPLTSVRGCVEGLETGVASNPAEYFSIIKKKTAAMEHIIEQLFLFSKLDMDEFPLDMRETDITLAIRDMIEESIAEYGEKGLDIKIGEMPGGVRVSADVIMLRNVIVNILENSVRYRTGERGRMEINAAVENDSVVLRMTDDGPGVPADVLPKLFNVFYRADASRTRQGSGLGLAISAKIVERMGGSIHAESPGGGGAGLATIIRLPVKNGGVC